jgi:hypothetical protein
MLHSVADRFLRNREQMLFIVRTPLPNPTTDLDVDRHGQCHHRFLGHLLNGLSQASILEAERSQLPHGSPRVTHALDQVLSKALQCVLCLRLRDIELARDEFELQRQGTQTLQQRVVNLPPQPSSFCRDQRELVPNRADPQPPHHRTRCRKEDDAAGVEP